MSTDNIVYEQFAVPKNQALPTEVVRGQPNSVTADKKTPTDVGRRLKEARLARGLRTNQLTNLAGVGVGVITRIENGRTRKAEGDTLAALATHLGVSVDWLLTGVGEGPQESPLPPEAASDVRPRSSAGTVVIKDPPETSEIRRMGDIPGWDEAVEEALQMFGDSLSRQDYDLAASIRGRELPEKIDAAAAAHWARTCAWQRDRNQRMKQEMSEVEAELLAWRKARGQR